MTAPPSGAAPFSPFFHTLFYPHPLCTHMPIQWRNTGRSTFIDKTGRRHPRRGYIRANHEIPEAVAEYFGFTKVDSEPEEPEPTMDAPDEELTPSSPSVTTIDGVGPATAEMLATKDILTVADLEAYEGDDEDVLKVQAKLDE